MENSPNVLHLNCRALQFNWNSITKLSLCVKLENSPIELESSLIESESFLIWLILKWIRDLSNSIRELCNWIGELSYSNIFHIAGVLAALESSLIELESSLIQIQSAANELVRSLIVNI